MNKIPQQIDKYRILAQVAEGGMGVIFKAEHPTLQRPVILKRLAFSGGEEAVERFRREARLMLGFRHDAIVDVYDHFRAGGFWYIVMEYVDGYSLDALLRERGPLPNDIALLIVLECARALKYAHDKGVVHRDVKPSNILVSRQGEVKITDFGIAVARDEDSTALTSTGITLGTVAYMSPEQIESSRDVDKRADIYSLGVTLYEMVAGKAPFPSSLTAQTIAMIQRGRVRPLRRVNPHVSPLVARIVRRAMRPSPRRRYQDLGELVKLLERGLRVSSSADVRRVLQGFLEGKAAPRVARRLGLGPRFAAAGAALAVLAAATMLAYREGIFHELLLAEQWGALVVRVEGPVALPPVVGVYREGGAFAVASTSLQPAGSGWISRRLYLPAGIYQVTVQTDGLQETRIMYVAPRAAQRRDEASRGGSVVSVSAAEELRNLRLPVRLRARAVDSASGRDITEGTRAAVKVGETWVPLDQAALESGRSYELRFERPGYSTATLAVKLAPSQTVLRVEAALAPVPGVVRISTTVTGVRLLVDGSDHYASVGQTPGYKQVPRLDARPQELALAPGRHSLEAERSDLGKATLRLSLEPGEKTAVVIEAQGGKLVLRKLDRIW